MNSVKILKILTAALLATACSNDATLEEENRVEVRQPMVFSAPAAQAETVVTRSGTPLEGTFKNFKVGTWKAFGQATQQNVMNGYRVEYSETAFTDYGDGYNWHYESIGSQVLRYWDLSAFPYEFRAIAPYDDHTDITTAGITINCADDYYFKSETRAGDNTNKGCEPYVACHVTRTQQADGTYEDTDIIKNEHINTAGKANATREVHMPFHHLMTKVGFRVFIDNPAPEQKPYHVILESMTISIHGKDGQFITGSKTYTASNTDGLNLGAFTDNTTVTTTVADPYPLLSHGQYYEPAGSATLLDLHQHLHRENAYDLTPGELLQIPQEDVEIKVEVKIKTNFNEETGELWDVGGTDYHEETYSRWLNIMHDEDAQEPSHFTWLPDNKYIFYLRIGNIHEHEIYLDTCEILPWDDVQTTDIDVGL